MAVVRGLSEFAGNFDAVSAKLRADLSEAILACCESTNPSLAAHALVAGIVLADSLGGEKHREAVWGKLQGASRWTALEFFETLGDYRLSRCSTDPPKSRHASDCSGCTTPKSTRRSKMRSLKLGRPSA